MQKSCILILNLKNQLVILVTFGYTVNLLTGYHKTACGGINKLVTDSIIDTPEEINEVLASTFVVNSDPVISE